MHASFREAAGSIGRFLAAGSVVRSAKNVRNAVVDRAFRRCGRAGGRRFAAELSARGIRDAVFTVAFNSPWVVDVLVRAWSRHQAGVPLVVMDNSSDATARSAHEVLCARHDVPYLALPWNPEWSPNRSHGIALNWTWFNVVRDADLRFAGFIDHDCIPVAAHDIRAGMRNLDAYGLYGASLTHPEAWNLWAGYCFLRPAAAVGRAVDFKHRIEHGLDTGGGNWRGWYRLLDPRRVGAAGFRWVQPDLGDGVTAAACLLLDEAFLHLEGASYRAPFRDARLRQRLTETILERPLVCRSVPPPGGGPARP